MATKKSKAVPAEAEVVSTPAAEAAPAVVRSRGPRGTVETARISLLVSENPKREGTKCQRVFAQYVDGMTIAEFCAALDAEGLGKEATPNMVYDSKHGFISIEGYEPPGGVRVKEPKPAKEPKAAKAPKAKKEKASVEEAPEAEEEVID
jgi:hypothetical protein